MNACLHKLPLYNYLLKPNRMKVVQFNEYEAQVRMCLSCSCKKAFIMVEELQHLSCKDSDL